MHPLTTGVDVGPNPFANSTTVSPGFAGVVTPRIRGSLVPEQTAIGVLRGYVRSTIEDEERRRDRLRLHALPGHSALRRR